MQKKLEKYIFRGKKDLTFADFQMGHVKRCLKLNHSNTLDYFCIQYFINLGFVLFLLLKLFETLLK